MARKSFVATVVGIAALVVPNAFADKGGIPHTGSSGQGRPAATQQTAPATTHGKALAKGHAKSHGTSHATIKSHPAGHALAKGHAKSHVVIHTTPAGPPATNTHAKAGKTTICHATGSATNPYVEITISNNALPAHQRHQDGRDIIPAPANGCPGATGSEQGGQPGGPAGKTTICHATGSATNPYVEITISNNALPAHQAHQDGRDIIPAPANGCPGATVQQAGQQPQTPGSVQEQAPAAPTTGASTTGVTPAAGVLGSTTSGSSGSPSKVRVLGATTSGRAPSASVSPAATTTRSASSSKLPFTGTDAIIVAILGLAALLLGVTARRVAATKQTKA